VKPEDVEKLLAEVAVEHNKGKKDYVLPVYMDLVAAIAVIGGLQLSLRHPQNNGPSAKAAREVVDRMIKRLREDGFHAYAQLASLGDDPRYDA
jgi:hypothetical protein